MQATTVEQYAKQWGKTTEQARRHLDDLVLRGMATKRVEMVRVAPHNGAGLSVFPKRRVAVYRVKEQ